MSNEKFTPHFTSNNSLSPKLVWMNNSRIKLEFEGSCLKQDKASFIPSNVVNLYTAYELNTWSQDLNAEFTVKDCLFGAAKLTKNANPNKYSYSGYGTEIPVLTQEIHSFQFQILIGVKMPLFLKLI